MECVYRVSMRNFPNCLDCGLRLSAYKSKRCYACNGKIRLGVFIKKDVGYYAVHRWVRKVYGSANKCEGDECKKESKFFEWSLLKGNPYERNRSYFWQLCKKCHNLYDKVYDGRQRNTRGQFV